MPTNHKITITNNGGLSVSSAHETVKPNETLSFYCDDNFAVFFKNARSPHSSGNQVVSGQGGTETKRLQIRHLSASEKMHPGSNTLGDTFSYGVAVLVPAAGPILTLDPDIIINDGGGGGRPRRRKKKR